MDQLFDQENIFNYKPRDKKAAVVKPLPFVSETEEDVEGWITSVAAENEVKFQKFMDEQYK